MAASIAETVAEIASAEGLDIGAIAAGVGDRDVLDARLASSRGDIVVTAEPDGRYQALFAGDGFEWARGWTADPAEAVRAAAAWRAGVTLRELTRRFPYVVTTGLAQAHEDGVAVPYRWAKLLADPALHPYRQMLRALSAHPLLGTLGPSVSHRNFVRLELSGLSHGYAEVHVIQLASGFQVEASWDIRPRRLHTPEAAAAAAADLVRAYQVGGGQPV